MATTRLVELLKSFPDSATAWESVTDASGKLQYTGTVLYYRPQTPETLNNPPPAAPTPVPSLFVVPLISGAEAKPTPVPSPVPDGNQIARLSALRSALPLLDAANSYDVNHARFSGDTQGWIGAAPGSVARPELRAQWSNLTNSDGKVTARYAYWMEDESFKANANLMGTALRGSNTLGDTPTQIPMQGLFKTALNSTDPNTIANDTSSLRASFPNSLLFEYRALNHVKDQPTLADSLKFVATIHSGASNLSRSGSKRINLNKIVSGSTDRAAIRTQLDQIIKTVTYHLPNFGQRFYRTAADKNSLDVPETSAAPHRTIYLNKIAANIRDYVDADSQPTVVNNDGDPTTSPVKPYTIRIGPPPAGALWTTPPTHPIETSGGGTSGASEIIAIGKEHVPFIQEYVLRVRQVAFAPRTGASASYTITIDHYVEFWNTSNRDISLTELGPNPFLLIADQPGWDAGGLSDIPAGASRDIKLPLNSARNLADSSSLVSFPAGSVVVLTTDPQPFSTPSASTPVTGPLTPDLTRVYNIPVTPDNGVTGLRTYSGQTQKKSGSELRLNIITRTTGQTDYETELVLGNDLGILESAWGAGAIGSFISVNIDNPTPPAPAENRLDETKYHFRGSSLRGNSAIPTPIATTGDPRTNAEQINFDLNSGAANFDKTRYYDSGLDSSHIPANSSLGAPNLAYVNPAVWPDPSSSAQGAPTAPAVIANANLSSIGQLGDIFDPVRTKGDSNNILLSRSGGRSLKVGQSDRYDATTNTAGLWDGNSNSASREWAAWRLADFFSTTDLVQLDGRININGVNRDGGAALKTALYGYAFQASPDSDPSLSTKGFDTDPTDAADKINELVRQIQARLRNDPSATAYSGQFGSTAGPFAERGEVSELPLFNTGTDLVAGVNTATANDRGREELFRRMAELITTRGNIFTVYAVGQSLVPQGASGSPTVTSTSQLKVTFRIDPVWNAGTPSDPTWDPAAATRFSKPDKYEVKILYAGE
ncbi:MAG TPA: hypothetical protein VM940_11350 [Chthoniobacterales bacterium]|nr:hypothetical protein [Chthoniobacterales bacterium]